ncbi:MAG: chromate resistance protein [Magnetococcales bacterium]|nr:chromate resistance protein [Magnetococcales bacterium]
MATPTPFLMLIFSLPARNATERMRAWRALKAMGGAMLRDGVYLLPENAKLATPLLDLATKIRQNGGTAEVVGIQPLDPQQENGLCALFDRTGEYTHLLEELAKLDPAMPDLPLLKRLTRNLWRRFTELAATDFFPTDHQTTTKNALLTLEKTIARRICPDEPTAQEGQIERRDPQHYQGRMWYTRANLWVDRVSSAWLIRKWIDPQARFVWLTPDQSPPGDGIGFDRDGGEFTHVGDRITFETLLTAFGLEQETGLTGIARLIHALDVGGTAPEAPGLEALLTAIKRRSRDDEAFLFACTPIFDDFYYFYNTQERTNG